MLLFLRRSTSREAVRSYGASIHGGAAATALQAPLSIQSKLLLQSLCKRGEKCQCVGENARFCPGGRQLFDSKRSCYMGEMQFFPPVADGQDAAFLAPLTIDREEQYDLVMKQFKHRAAQEDKAGRGAGSELMAMIGPPGEMRERERRGILLKKERKETFG